VVEVGMIWVVTSVENLDILLVNVIYGEDEGSMVVVLEVVVHDIVEAQAMGGVVAVQSQRATHHGVILHHTEAVLLIVIMLDLELRMEAHITEIVFGIEVAAHEHLYGSVGEQICFLQIARVLLVRLEVLRNHDQEWLDILSMLALGAMLVQDNLLNAGYIQGNILLCGSCIQFTSASSAH